MFRARASVVLGILGLAGCPSDGAITDLDASASCVAATHHDDLPWLQDNVLAPSCANFSSCHQGAASTAGGLSLEAGRTHDQLVDVPSSRFPSWVRVVPGNPMQSYLMVVLGQYTGPLTPEIGTMPYNSGLLCKDKRDAIERWIVAGAPATPPADAGVDGP